MGDEHLLPQNPHGLLALGWIFPQASGRVRLAFYWCTQSESVGDTPRNSAVARGAMVAGSL